MVRSGAAVRFAGGFAVVFGLLTLISGGAVLTGGAGAREAAGQIVPFVVWFNALAGIFYVIAGLLMIARHRAAFLLSLGIALATGIVGALFAVHVAQGGPYEMRTVFALGFRFGVWGLLAFVAWHGVNKQMRHAP